MIAFVVVAMVCGTVLLIGHRAAAVLTTKWDAERRQQLATDAITSDELASRYANDRDLEARRVAVLERDIALKERQATDRPADQPMPSDLHERIHAWEDPFAQELEQQNIQMLYAELRDWDKVRTKLAPLTPVVERREGLVQ